MSPFDPDHIPRCTIDFPLEISPEEISSLTGPINTLLKSSVLLGHSFEIDATFMSLFDIAEEIAGVDASGFLISPENIPGTWELRFSRRVECTPVPERHSDLVAPAVIAAHYGKPVSMDPEWGPWSAPICEAWSSRSLVSFPLRRNRDVMGVLVFGKREHHPFTMAQMKLLWVLSMQAENQLNRIVSPAMFSYYAILDPLTHLYNRRHFESRMEIEVQRSRRTGEPFSLLVLDIDGFRAYNERFHSSSGDIALQEFAGILENCVREVDTVARLGADEFATLLPKCDAEGAQSLARRIIMRLRSHPLPGVAGGRSEYLAASVGVASFPADSFDKNDLMYKAELSLGIARNLGGGQVCVYHETGVNGTLKSPPQHLPVHRIFDAARSVVNLDNFLEILLLTGMQGLGAGRGSIVAKVPGGGVVLRAAIGFSRQEDHLLHAGSIRPGPVTSWVVDHQIPLVVSKQEDFPLPLPKKKNGYSADSFISIPLTCGGRTLGVLHLTNRKDQRPFTRDDLRAFAPIASQIAEILDQGMSFRENLRTFSLSILGSLSRALELRFPFLAGHSARVGVLSARIGERMGLSGDNIAALATAAELHDVGIVGIPGNILTKKRRLNESELEMARKHPFFGAKMLEGLPGMDTARRAVLEHHEHYDGSGYPYGLREEDISLPARILSVAEFYDSVVSERPYRGAVNPAEALNMIRNGSGTLFDPEVARIFLENVNDLPGVLNH